MLTVGGCAQLQAMVHGVTTEECQAALQSHSWSVQRAAQYLKVPYLLPALAFRDPEDWVCSSPPTHPLPTPLPGSPRPCPCLAPRSPSVSHGTTFCSSGGAAIWVGSAAPRRVPQSAGDVRLEPGAGGLSPAGLLRLRPPQVSSPTLHK